MLESISNPPATAMWRRYFTVELYSASLSVCFDQAQAHLFGAISKFVSAKKLPYAAVEHTASTATLFITSGQGSPPKLLGEIATTHLCSPMHFFSRTEFELIEWHSPCWNVPQVPRGVPKLANLIAEMVCPGAHFKCTFAVWNSGSP